MTDGILNVIHKLYINYTLVVHDFQYNETSFTNTAFNNFLIFLSSIFLERPSGLEYIFQPSFFLKTCS